MYKLFLLIMMGLLTFNFASPQADMTTTTTEVEEVQASELENLNLDSGLYVVDDSPESPTFFLEKDKLEWRTTRCLATSHSIGGKIFATKDGFVATSPEGIVEVHFKVDEGNTFSITAVSSTKNDLDFWLKEGQVFHLKTAIE